MSRKLNACLVMSNSGRKGICAKLTIARAGPATMPASRGSIRRRVSGVYLLRLELPGEVWAGGMPVDVMSFSSGRGGSVGSVHEEDPARTEKSPVGHRPAVDSRRPAEP